MRQYLLPSDGSFSWFHRKNWSARSDAVKERFQSAKARWADGDRVPLFLASDTIAWHQWTPCRCCCQSPDRQPWTGACNE